MISVGAFFGNFVVRAPVFAVLVIGLILLGTQGQRLPPRSRQLARIGLVIMLVQELASMLWTALLPQLMSHMSYDHGFVRTYGIASAIVGFIMSLLFAAGLGFLLGALLAARPPGPPAWAPPPGAPGWEPPPGSPGREPPGGSVPPGDR